MHTVNILALTKSILKLVGLLSMYEVNHLRKLNKTSKVGKY